jgi:hypothetical protein
MHLSECVCVSVCLWLHARARRAARCFGGWHVSRLGGKKLYHMYYGEGNIKLAGNLTLQPPLSTLIAQPSILAPAASRPRIPTPHFLRARTLTRMWVRAVRPCVRVHSVGRSQDLDAL